MINKTLQAEQAKKAVYTKPSLSELNNQETAGGTAGTQENFPMSMNTNRKDQGTS